MGTAGLSLARAPTNSEGIAVRQVALHAKVAQLEGLLGTSDLTDWESGFVQSLVHHGYAKDSTKMSEKQVEMLDRVWSKHFA
jgi:hypothetical protein